MGRLGTTLPLLEEVDKSKEYWSQEYPSFLDSQGLVIGFQLLYERLRKVSFLHLIVGLEKFR